MGRDGVCAVFAAIHHQDPQPGTGQDQRGGGTRGPGSDHDHVVRRDRRCAHRMRRDNRVSGITTWVIGFSLQLVSGDDDGAGRLACPGIGSRYRCGERRVQSPGT